MDLKSICNLSKLSSIHGQWQYYQHLESESQLTISNKKKKRNVYSWNDLWNILTILLNYYGVSFHLCPSFPQYWDDQNVHPIKSRMIHNNMSAVGKEIALLSLTNLWVFQFFLRNQIYHKVGLLFFFQNVCYIWHRFLFL